MLRSTLAVAVATVSLIASSPAALAGDAPPLTYVAPVDGPVVDGWRPPASRYGAGNRGIDLSSSPGEPVRAAAEGTVVFAGRIGPSSHVVVLHPDGVRTSYSFLESVEVRRGDRVAQGDTVGVAGERVHFGARIGGDYLDPNVLLGDGPPRVRLVSTDLPRPLAEWRERRGLLDQLGGALHAAARTGLEAATTTGRLAASAGWSVTEPALRVAAEQWRRLDESLRAWGHVANRVTDHRPQLRRRWERVLEDQAACTPATVPTPDRFDRRRIAVLIGGLGSASGHAAVLDLDTAALGYGDGDVLQLSYEGGQVPLPGRTVEGIPTSDYDRASTWGDLRVPAAHLRRLLVDLARAHPGVPVDLIAHSQGGIVARAALAGADLWDPTMPVVEHLVTLGTPHHGAVGGTAAAAIDLLPGGAVTLDAVHVVSDGAVPAGARAARDLSSSSRLIVDELGRRSVPAGTQVASIAASGDLVVDAQLSAIDGASNSVVHLEGTGAHDALPGHAATAREVALALHGMGPTCRPRAELLADLTLADAIDLANAVRYVGDVVEDHVLRRIAPQP